MSTTLIAKPPRTTRRVSRQLQPTAQVAAPGGVLLMPAYVLNFEAAGSYASIPSIAAYDFGTGDFCLEIWAAGVRGGPLAALVGTSGPLFTVSVDEKGDISLLEAGRAVAAVGQPTSVTDSNWHQVSVSRTSGILSLYLDGVEVARSAETSAFSIAGVTQFLIGAGSTAPNTPTYGGTYADVRLWNSARTQEQVQQNRCYRVMPSSSLVGYWTFVGQSLTDQSNNHNDGGTLLGNAIYAYMPINSYPSIGALRLNGSATTVAIAGNAAYNVGAGDFTIEAWLQPFRGGTLLARTTPSGAGFAGLSLALTSDGRLTFTTSNGTNVTTVVQNTPSAQFLTNWHHVGVRRKSSVITIYVDGIPVATGTESIPISIDVAAATPLVLGTADIKAPARAAFATRVSGNAGSLPDGVEPYTLQMAEIRLWKAALTQDQLYRGMLIESHGDEQNLIGYWNFANGNVIDRSPTRNLQVSPYTATIGTAPLPIALAQYVLQLPGTPGSYMTAPYAEAFDFGTGDFTLEARFRATEGGTLISRPADPSKPSCGFQARLTAFAATLTLGPGNVFTANVALLDGAWHHIAWTRTAGKIGLYVNDLPVSCTPTPSTDNIATPTNLVVGAAYDSVSNQFDDFIAGAIDFVYLWNSAIPLTQFQATSYISIGAAAQDAVGAWTFDQQAPIDISRSNANGALGASAKIVADATLAVTVPLSTAHLPGSGSNINCSNRSDLSFGGVQPYTLGAWVKPMETRATGTIISRYDAAGASEYRLRIVNGVPVAERTVTGGTVTGVTQLQADWWYFVSMTYDGVSLRVQVNGITEKSAALGAIQAASATPVVIGASANGPGTTDTLAACIESVQVWTEALETPALQSFMNEPLTGIEPGLQAYWNFIYGSQQDWTGHGTAAVFSSDARFQATTRANQPIRSALALAGGAYLNCGGGRSLNIRGAMTLETWFRLDAFSTPWQAIISKGSVYQIRRYNETNQITFSTSHLSNQELPSAAELNLLDGNWHHVAAVFDGTNKYLYIDGALSATAPASGNISVGNGVLYIADNVGEILVVDQETGNEIWTARMFKPIQTTPVTDKNVMCVGSPSGDIFAFDYSTRKRLWDAQIPQGYQVPLTIHRDVVYFSGAGTAISAVDLLTGAPLWKMNGIANDAAPLIVDQTAYYATQYSVFARDLVSGRVKWTYSLRETIIGAPVIFDDVLFVSAGKSVYALKLGKVTTGGGSFTASSPLVGAPVIENGIVYVVTTDGTVTALSYNTVMSAFATVWTAKISSGVKQLLSVDFPYVGVVGNDNNLYAYNAANGTLIWQWSSGTGHDALSGLTVVNGAAYVSASSGIYSALDLQNKRVLWSKDLQTVAAAPAAVTYAPFCIGASVDEQGNVTGGTFEGLIAEVRLWQEARTAADIAATWHRKFVGDEQGLAGYWPCSTLQSQEPDLSAHLNPGAYVGSVYSSLVDLPLVDPLPRILAQAQMMQNWSAADVTTGNVSGQVAFRTEITLIDGSGSPLIGTNIKVFTDALTTISIGGVAYEVDNTRAAQVMTDARGMISVVTPCKELTSSTLQIWTEFMAPDERVIIHPDENLSKTLESVQGSDLIDPAKSTNPLLKGKPPLLTNVTETQANGLASAINNAVQNVKRPATAPSRFAAQPRAIMVGGTSVQGDVVSQAIALIDGMPYAQYVAPGTIPNWQFNFQTYAFAPLHTEDVARMRAMRMGTPVLTTGEEGFWDLWNDFVNGVKRAANVIIEAVGNAVKIVVEWIDSGIATLEHIFQSVAEVGQAIYGMFKQLLSDIVDAAKKIYEFFAFLFDWDDILRTKDAIIGYVRQSMSQVGGQIDQFIAQGDAFFDRIEADLDSAFELVIGRIGKQSVSQLRDSAPAINPLMPPSAVTRSSSAAALRMSTDSQAAFGTEGNWLISATMENSSGTSGGGMLTWNNEATGYLASALEEIAQIVGTSRALNAFKSSYQYFAQIGSNPEAFLQLIVQGLLEAVKGLAELAIEIAKAAFDLLLRAVKMFINIMLDALAAPINIPVVSWLYKEISHADLSMLDLIALIAAIPTTIIYKAFTGEAPFKQSGAVNGRSGQLVGADLAPWQKALKTVVAVLQILVIPVAMILDVQEVVPLETRVGPVGGPYTHTVAPWQGRIAGLFTAANLATANSPRLGPSLVRWLNFGLKFVYTSLSAPWIYESSPTDFEKYAWLFYLIELTVVEFFFALYTQVTGLAWMLNDFAWAIPTAVGLFRFFAVIVATAVSDERPAPSTVASAFFSPLPSLFKFLRWNKIVAATDGISIVILLLVDLLCGIVPPTITLAATWFG